MFGLFDSLFKWFYKNDDEKNGETDPYNHSTADMFTDQRKVQFNFNGQNDRSYQRRYMTRETQTDTPRKRETISCEVMTDSVDFPLSLFDTEPTQKKVIKEAKHTKYGFKDPIKIDENFNFDFTFHNIEYPTFNSRFNSYDNDKESERTIIETETENQNNRIDQKNNENQLGTEQQTEDENQSETGPQTENENQTESENQYENENQSRSENQSGTENQSESVNQSGTENQSYSENQSGAENHSYSENQSGYEEEDYDNTTETES